MSVLRLSSKSTQDLLLCLFSLLLVVLAPKHYSYNYCLLIHNLYVLTFAYNVYRKRKEGVLSFFLLFSVSFYCTSFIYPVFIYGTSERYFSMFSYGFDESLISYCTAIAYMAYSFLLLGLNNISKRSKLAGCSTGKYKKAYALNLENKLNILSTIFFGMLVYFLVEGGLGHFTNQFIYSLSENDKIMGYAVQFLTPLAYSMLILSFNLPQKKCFSFLYANVLVAIYIISILSTGSRTIPISIIIMLLLLYNDKVRKMRSWQLLILGAFFILVLSLAGALRGEGQLITTSDISKNAAGIIEEKSENYFSFANELIMCNRNLYYLIETTDKVGYTYGVTMLGNLLGIIPFLRGLFLSITGVPAYMIGSGLYNTVLTTGPNYTRGLGTHVVSDVYVCWGIIGVILLFYLYGYIITYLKNSSGNLLKIVAYYVLSSNAIYACRASMLDVNDVVWTVFIVYVILHIGGNTSFHYK